MLYEWDEGKRRSNWEKHGLDLADGALVFENPHRLDVPVRRGGETRTQSFAYVFERLAVLSLVHTARGDVVRLISLRYASSAEREVYHEWLAHYPHDE